jgi:hypothetical protein
MRFSAFVDRKVNKARKELEVVRDVLAAGGVKVEDHLKDQDPYLFIPSTKQSLDFGGVRIYKIGSDLAYRLQNEEGTEPYGASYSMDIEGMFEDLISEMGEDKAAEEVKKAVVEEINGFFERSLKAQDELASSGFDPHSKIMVVPGKAGDLSNMM